MKPLKFFKKDSSKEFLEVIVRLEQGENIGFGENESLDLLTNGQTGDIL